MNEEEIRRALSDLRKRKEYKSLDNDLAKLQAKVDAYQKACKEEQGAYQYGSMSREHKRDRDKWSAEVDRTEKAMEKQLAAMQKKYRFEFSEEFLAGPEDLTAEKIFDWISKHYVAAKLFASPRVAQSLGFSDSAEIGVALMSKLFLDRFQDGYAPNYEEGMRTAMQYVNPSFQPRAQQKDSMAPAEPVAAPDGHSLSENPEPQPGFGSANVDFIMKEMFRLNERMKRNSRGTQHLKDLTGKLDELEKSYNANPAKYRNMSRDEFKREMDAVMLSTDAYIADKKALTSFSATQLERLKCMNQLKSLQESLSSIPENEDFVYFNVRSANLDYMKKALAEKLVLAGEVKSQKGNLMCDREQLRIQTNAFLQSDDFKLFLNDAIQKGTEGKSLRPEQTIEILLKQNGQQMRKAYLSRVKELKQPAEAAAPAITEKQRDALKEKANAAIQASADYIEYPAKIHNLVDNKFSRTAPESEKMFYRFAVNHPSIPTGSVTVGSCIKDMKKAANRITGDTYIREQISASDNLKRELSTIENACKAYIKERPDLFDSLVKKELDDSTLVKQWPELNNNLGCYKIAYQYSDDPHAKSVIAKYDRMKARIDALAAGRALNAETDETVKKGAGPNLG